MVRMRSKDSRNRRMAARFLEMPSMAPANESLESSVTEILTCKSQKNKLTDDEIPQNVEASELG